MDRSYSNSYRPGRVQTDELSQIRRRVLGEHLTSKAVFQEYILPHIRPVLSEYTWIDLYAGEGNLVLPILEEIPRAERVNFFQEHVLLFDIQPEMVQRAVGNAVDLGIPLEIAQRNIRVRDTIMDFPSEVLERKFPAFHITNPPYLYLGYVRKHKETRHQSNYFSGPNRGLQDVYQVCLMNDLRHGLDNLIYVIPSNFLFGYSVSNMFRDQFLPHYRIKRAVIFEKRIFQFTGTNVVIAFFERKSLRTEEPQTFVAVKINSQTIEKTFALNRRNHYRAGDQFEDFVAAYRARHPVHVKFYVMLNEVLSSPGQARVRLLDSNKFDGRAYSVREFSVSLGLANKIRANLLWVRTVDTGSKAGRAGLLLIRESFGADGILVSAAPYRTNPIQLILSPQLTEPDQGLLMNYTNLLLEHFRLLTDSEFMTTYKYSDSQYTRKYLGLSQVKRLIETFPILDITESDKSELGSLVSRDDAASITSFLGRVKRSAHALEAESVGQATLA